MLLQLRQRKFWNIHIQILTNFKKIHIQPISYISSITNLYISSIPKNLYVAWWTISLHFIHPYTEKVNITIEFCILELVWIPNFSLNNLDFFWPNLPTKGISGRTRKNCTCACAHGRYLLYWTFPHGGRQSQRYFNVSSPSSRRDN